MKTKTLMTNRKLPKGLSAIQAEKKRLKAEADGLLNEMQPANLAKGVIRNDDIKMLVEIINLTFYPKKTRNMKLMSLAMPILFVAANKLFEQFIVDEH